MKTMTYNKSMEPVIETREQARRYMELADSVVYGPCPPLCGPSAPPEIVAWCDAMGLKEDNRLIMASTVMGFRFAAAAYRFMAATEG